jgi:hypothetical protein
MPDISMCSSGECPSANRCYRFIAIPHSYRQSYSKFDPIGCENFIDVKGNYYGTTTGNTDNKIDEDLVEPFRG